MPQHIPEFDLTIVVSGRFEGYDRRPGESDEGAQSEIVHEVQSRVSGMLQALNEEFEGVELRIVDYHSHRCESGVASILDRDRMGCEVRESRE